MCFGPSEGRSHSACALQVPGAAKAELVGLQCPKSPRSAVQREGVVPAAACPVQEFPLLKTLAGRSLAFWLAKGHALLCLLDAFPAGCRSAEEAGVPYGEAGDGGCPSGPQAGSASRRALQQSGWAGLEQVPCPDHELEQCICLVLEGGLAGPCTVLPLTSRQCLWRFRALLYLQELAQELTSVYQPPAPTEGAQEPQPELQHIQRKRRSRRKKDNEADSDDPARDADFVPSKEILLQAEEEEGSEEPLSEASEPELEVLRGHSGKTASAGVRAGSLPWPLVIFGLAKCLSCSGALSPAFWGRKILEQDVRVALCLSAVSLGMSSLSFSVGRGSSK